ncbi:MAG: RNA-binding transcriptional accessory protein, partial [Clostridiales bacterium]|nr:RNA-binding transcriptional accessory protein [Clostridiales bacterium]
MDHIAILSKELSLNPAHVKNIVALIDEGATIPFIARYRKELTGSCDDQVLRILADRLAYLRNLDKRKEEVMAAITALDKLTDELKASILAAATLAEVEDLYRPYKAKRRTRATIARERGLEPLAAVLIAQELKTGSLEDIAAGFINPEKDVPDVETALAGAMDIVAEDISDDADIRKKLREFARSGAVLTSKAAKDEDSVYRMYYDYSESVSKVPGYRVLAVNRGEKEEFLKATVEMNGERAVGIISKEIIKGQSLCREYLEKTVTDAWQRLIAPSLEREVRAGLTEAAHEQAINMFGVNLRPLLMQPPVKSKAVLGLDPAYRTGCKLAVVDAFSNVLDTGVIYPLPSHGKVEAARKTVAALLQKHGVTAVAIGNGTA